MSERSDVLHRGGSVIGRLVRAWRSLPPERRMAALAAVVLFLTLFLPWYQRQYFALISGKLVPASDSQSGWGAFSFVEAAVLLVAFGVLTLLFHRAEGRAFHLPGGDGWVITAAGFWTCVLIVWRIFDKQGGATHGHFVTTSGIEFGIFVALADAAVLAYAGSRIRAAHAPEPPLPGERTPPSWGPSAWEPGPARRPEPRVRDERPAPRSSALASDRLEVADPPEMPTRRLRPKPAPPPGPDDQLTIPFEDPTRPG